MIFALDAVKFLSKKLLEKSLCKLLQIFPPKVLVYIRNIFLDTFFIDLIENYSVCLLVTKEILKKNTLNIKLCWFIKYIIENNKKDNNWTLYFIDLLTHSTYNIRRQQVNKYWGLLAKLSTFALVKKKKKTAHAYFRHRIFSKSFGGKIRHIWTDVTYRVK